MKVHFTTDPTIFADLDVLPLQQFTLSDKKIPTNIEFGKVYYRMRDNKLVAFKILAMSIVKGDMVKTMSDQRKSESKIPFVAHLVQYADGSLCEWVKHILSTPIFTSKEHYIAYANGGVDAFKVEYVYLSEYLKNIPNIDFDWDRLGFGASSIKICQTYRWTNDNRALLYQTYIEKILIVNEGIFIQLNHNKDWDGSYKRNGYPTKDACVKSRLDGLEMVDFETESISLNIQIEITKPSITKLKVVEFK
jgi:hypothetical protein